MKPNKLRPRDPDRVRHMVEAAEWLVHESQGINLAALLQDRRLHRALEREFEILGEAAAHVSAETQQLWPSVPWLVLKNYRNFIAHEYFRPDYADMLYSAQVLLPPILPELRLMLAATDAEFGPDANLI